MAWLKYGNTLGKSLLRGCFGWFGVIYFFYFLQLLKESPSVNDAIVLSSAQFGAMPEQRLRFIPIYFAGAIGN